MEPNPLTTHLLGWFQELNDSRSFTVVAGMGGGACLPDAIGWQTMAAWSQLTGNDLTVWEVETLKRMDKAWRAAYGDKKGGAPAQQHQGVGEYCKGEHVADCKKQFGAGLPQICATCPD